MVFVILKLIELDAGIFVITVYRAEKRPQASKSVPSVVVVVKKKRRKP